MVGGESVIKLMNRFMLRCGSYCLISPALNRLLALTVGVVPLDSSAVFTSSPVFEVELSALSASFLLVKVWTLSPR